jgi:hypothetical protein
MTEIRGRIITRHAHPDCVAEALGADNLSSMTTSAADGCVVTDVRGTRLRSIIASADDYLMNLAIAEDICSLVSH